MCAPLNELTLQKTSILTLNNVDFDFFGLCLLGFASSQAEIAEYVSNIKSSDAWGFSLTLAAAFEAALCRVCS